MDMANIPIYLRHAASDTTNTHESDTEVPSQCEMTDFVFSSINYVAKIAFFHDTCKNGCEKNRFFNEKSDISSSKRTFMPTIDKKAHEEKFGYSK